MRFWNDRLIAFRFFPNRSKKRILIRGQNEGKGYAFHFVNKKRYDMGI